MPLWIELIFALLIVLFLLVITSFTPRQWPRSPRESHARLKKLGWFLVAIFVFNTGVGILTDNALMAGASAVALAMWLYILFFSGDALSDQANARINYAMEPERCGRCEYNLTGNVSGTCPECGWKLPAQPVTIQRPDWGLWWRKWRIEHLDEPRRLRRQLLSNVLMVGAAGLVAWYWTWAAMAALVVAAHWGINLLRIRAYERSAANAASAEER